MKPNLYNWFNRRSWRRNFFLMWKYWYWLWEIVISYVSWKNTYRTSLIIIYFLFLLKAKFASALQNNWLIPIHNKEIIVLPSVSIASKILTFSPIREALLFPFLSFYSLCVLLFPLYLCLPLTLYKMYQQVPTLWCCGNGGLRWLNRKAQSNSGNP